MDAQSTFIYSTVLTCMCIWISSGSNSLCIIIQSCVTRLLICVHVWEARDSGTMPAYNSCKALPPVLKEGGLRTFPLSVLQPHRLILYYGELQTDIALQHGCFVLYWDSSVQCTPLIKNSNKSWACPPHTPGDVIALCINGDNAWQACQK